MNRRAFLVSSGTALAAFPAVARATGGIDVGESVSTFTVRVLLAAGAFEPPHALDAWRFSWKDRSYRGAFSTVMLDDGRTGLLNTVPLDAYLAGVLSAEISPSWPSAAQQAQAVVSRTYALGRLRPTRPFDVVASESDQHYAGVESETVEGRAAVESTSGTIVTFAGAPAKVAYSSCCGGCTADATDAWHADVPYLHGVPDPHCVDTPNYRWDATVPLDDVSRALGKPFAQIGRVTAVELRDALVGGRPRTVAFAGDRGALGVTPYALRTALGTSVVRGTFVRDARVNGDALALNGTGRGHGIGLCQWGARVLARDGATAADIVAFYLPGTAFGRV